MLTTLPPPCAVVIKSGNLNFLEPSGPLQACNWTDIYIYICVCVCVCMCVCVCLCAHARARMYRMRYVYKAIQVTAAQQTD